MSEERMKILKMVAEGKITPEEADRLLGALKESSEKARFFRVRVSDKTTNRTKVKVDIPIGVLKFVSKLGTVFKGLIPEKGFKMNIKGKEIYLDEMTPEMLDAILNEITEGGKFTLVEVDDEDENQHVEVFIE
uniref:YvlB/LiaX N-terminal domain-containing protein n=1 Tax=candidate division WOR-3 bacterium TaxID=2052148 RepID=A0A7C4TCH8_UNCW3